MTHHPNSSAPSTHQPDSSQDAANLASTTTTSSPSSTTEHISNLSSQNLYSVSIAGQSVHQSSSIDLFVSQAVSQCQGIHVVTTLHQSFDSKAVGSSSIHADVRLSRHGQCYKKIPFHVRTRNHTSFDSLVSFFLGACN